MNKLQDTSAKEVTIKVQAVQQMKELLLNITESAPDPDSLGFLSWTVGELDPLPDDSN